MIDDQVFRRLRVLEALSEHAWDARKRAMDSGDFTAWLKAIPLLCWAERRIESVMMGAVRPT